MNAAQTLQSLDTLSSFDAPAATRVSPAAAEVLNATPARATRLKHSPATQALHWGSALLFVVAAGTIIGREFTEDQALRSLLLTTHRQAGVLVLLAWAARLAVRSVKGMAHTDAHMPRLMRLVAQAMHWALYALILAIPMLGWALTNAHGVDVKLFGVLPLPTITGADSDFADTLTDYHLMASWTLLGLVTAHVGAALFHHVVVRDQVLSAMLPRRFGPRQPAAAARLTNTAR